MQEQGEKRHRQEFGKIAAHVDDQQRVGICRIADSTEKSRSFGQNSAHHGKRQDSRHRLHQYDEHRGHRIPRQETSQCRTQQPRERRIKNKSRLAKTVIRPLRPTRKKNPLFPLPGGIQPRRRVKLKIMSRSNSQHKKRRHNQQRRAKRNPHRPNPFPATKFVQTLPVPTEVVVAGLQTRCFDSNGGPKNSAAIYTVVTIPRKARQLHIPAVRPHHN